ncbi:MAG: GHMP family kinase ATP-binding protein [Planctomycetota bacterium]|jgi:D-glycero-alpha-D-manno-heptose-7-phosphate kinase
MIISRTPLRISLFGGGTQCPGWYRTNGASALTAAIDKYCYISCRVLPPFFEHKTRVVYSRIENCREIDQIRHPAVREILRFMKIDYGLEIHHDADLPARTGMGSDSAFTVGLLHALQANLGIMPTKKRLAAESVRIERDILNEPVAPQDQVCAAYGGINKINFAKDGQFQVTPIHLPPRRIDELNSQLMLLFIENESQNTPPLDRAHENTNARQTALKEMQALVGQAVDLLQSEDDISRFAQLLDRAGTLERAFSPNLAETKADKLYRKAKKAGALGGKTTRPDGAGFLLLFVPPNEQKNVRQALAKNIYVPFQFEFTGSRIIFYKSDREDYKKLHKKTKQKPQTRISEIKDQNRRKQSEITRRPLSKSP